MNLPPPPPGRPHGLWTRLWGGPPQPGNPQTPPDPVRAAPPPTVDGAAAAENLFTEASTEEIPVYRPPTPGTETAAELTAAETTERPALQLCPACSAPRRSQEAYCGECGWLFPRAGAAAETTPPAPLAPLLADFELLAELPVRPGLQRWLARHRRQPSAEPVMLLLGPAGQVRFAPEPAPDDPSFDFHDMTVSQKDVVTVVLKDPGGMVCWPSLAWLKSIYARAPHPVIPRILEERGDGESELLVLEIPAGRTLWDAWDDPLVTMAQRCQWLIELAEFLHLLHQAGAVFEGFRPDLLIVDAQGQVRIVDATDLLPLPLPSGIPVQATSYSAPEYLLFPDHVDGRADLYSFGAVLYSLYLGRELTEMDFELQGVPKPFVQLFPDAHPLLTRILLKTLTRDLSQRFPTEEGYIEDPTGFVELIKTLRQAAAVLGQVRLEVASWTSTGVIRSSNEDAFAVLHAASGRQDDLHDCALLLLADGMGGCAAGEVASAMAIDHLRSSLLQEAPFLRVTNSPLATNEVFPAEKILGIMTQALQDANQAIYMAARAPGHHRRGMGCTAEVVFIQGDELFAAHLGDSRLYIYSQGRLELVSRDQTFVQRLVELGQITEEEAQYHPRRNELQQALGGLPIVEPLTYHRRLQPGDVVLVCSDGLTTHVEHEALQQIIERAPHAESIARRLVNFANYLGGVDNTTVIVVRVQ
jgi:serine/threonine protein phosphatase PrpC